MELHLAKAVIIILKNQFGSKWMFLCRMELTRNVSSWTASDVVRLCLEGAAHAFSDVIPERIVCALPEIADLLRGGQANVVVGIKEVCTCLDDVLPLFDLLLRAGMVHENDIVSKQMRELKVSLSQIKCNSIPFLSL